MSNNTYDLIVIGAGPGGYVAAIAAAQHGMSVACIEKQYLGGTCLNVGCIPSKALLQSTQYFAEAQHDLGKHGIKATGVTVDLPTMLARKDEVVKSLTGGVGALFKKNKVQHVVGQARVVAADTVQVAGPAGESALKARHILIATGSAPSQIPALPFDGKFVLSSTEALSLPQIPKRLIVVGAGYIGLEIGSVWLRLGTQVLVLEFTDGVLPLMDRQMAGLLHKQLVKQGMQFRFKTMAQGVKILDDQVEVAWSSEGQTGMEAADRVLVAVGRRPVTDGLGLAELGVVLDQRGFIKVDQSFVTSVPGIYAIGDVIGGMMLAHKAEEEGIAAVERMCGEAGIVNYSACPSVVYTHPELAQVGLSEEDAAKRGPIKVGKFPFLANGRARCLGQTDGQVKVIADARTDRLLGVHIIGPGASDLIAEATVAMEFAASAEDLARSFHAHPTLAEAIKEAALAVDKRAIHI